MFTNFIVLINLNVIKAEDALQGVQKGSFDFKEGIFV